MTPTITETVLFRLNPGITDDAFLAAAGGVGAVLDRTEGYVGRTLGRTADGEWIDIVRWTDLASAERAMEVIMTAPECHAMMAAIDASTIVMRHSDIRLSHE
jgi:hypothetical protein